MANGDMHIDKNLGPFEAVRNLKLDAPMPNLFPVRRQGCPPVERNVSAAVCRELDELASLITPNMTVAVTAGSRGIHNVAAILRASVDWLKASGARPFIVPAMGSHGGATADGQIAVLKSLGITEDSMGVPIRATMETVLIGRLDGGPEVHLDAFAAAADGILLVNRVKPHTDFHGAVESGLAKILMIGLGKHAGATALHASGAGSMGRWISEGAGLVVRTGRVLGGLGIVENSMGETASITYVPGQEIAGPAETALLRKADSLIGKLPFEQLDVLIVDTMGKDKAGTGLDTNVIGRTWIHGVKEIDGCDISVVTVHDLSEASHGNAVGMGLADMMPFRLFEKIDLFATYVNAQTAGEGGVRRAKMPMVLPNDRSVVATAMRMCGRADTSNIRMVRIRDTLAMDELLVSEALRESIENSDDFQVVGTSKPITFDSADALVPWRSQFKSPDK